MGRQQIQRGQAHAGVAEVIGQTDDQRSHEWQAGDDRLNYAAGVAHSGGQIEF